jgi:hypothetical protein
MTSRGRGSGVCYWSSLLQILYLGKTCERQQSSLSQVSSCLQQFTIGHVSCHRNLRQNYGSVTYC